MPDENFYIGVRLVGIAVVKPFIKQETEPTPTHVVLRSLWPVDSQRINGYLQDQTSHFTTKYR